MPVAVKQKFQILLHAQYEIIQLFWELSTGEEGGKALGCPWQLHQHHRAPRASLLVWAQLLPFPSPPLEVITVIPQAGNHRGLPPLLTELSQDPTWSPKFQNNPLRGAPTESAASHGTKPPAPERLRGHRGTTGEPAVLSSVCSLAWR